MLYEVITRENDLYLKGFSLSENLFFTSDLETAIKGRDLLVLVSPSQVMRKVLRQAAPHIDTNSLIVSAAKGIENNSLQTMAEVITDCLGSEWQRRLTFISGPSFAREVAAEMPTALVVAGLDGKITAKVQEIFSTAYFRVS